MTNRPIATTCYASLLYLYPGTFRRQFGDEMADVFEEAVTNAGRRGSLSLLAFWLHELITLIPAILAEHGRVWRKNRHTPESAARFDLAAARWIARIVSLLICGILLDGFNSLATLPFGLIQIVGLAGLLLAWRWEVLGGRLVLTAGAIIGVAVTALTTLAAGPNHLLVCLLSGLFWSAPFLIFGWLFIKIGRHQQRLRRRAA